MTEENMRNEFEQWRDESPNQRYGYVVWEAWQAGCASRQEEIEKQTQLETLPVELDEYIRHTLNAVDNLSDMPISKRWAKKWTDKAVEMLERNNYFRELSPDAHEEKLPVNPEEVYSPHTEIIK